MPETICLLKTYAKVGSYQGLREKVLRDNLLAKMSSTTTTGLLTAFRRRFLIGIPSLPPTELLTKMLETALPEIAKNQILFPYYLLSDALVENVYRHLVLPSISENCATLSKDDVVMYLSNLSVKHSELQEWAEYTKLRWARGMLALLRSFNLLERAPSTELKTLNLRREAFAFYWQWLRQKRLSIKEAAAQDLWPLFQVSSVSMRELLYEGQGRGWWTYHESGQIAEFNPSYSSVEEWLEYAFG